MAKIKIGIIGKDGRTTAVERQLKKNTDVVCEVHSDGKNMRKPDALDIIRRSVRRFAPDFVFIGNEEPLEVGVVDLLRDEFAIPCIGPTRKLAQIESSKAFTRNLVEKHGISGNPKFKVFRSLNGIEAYLAELGEFVVKPDGLTGGKGVKVSNVHMFSLEEALGYCREILESDHAAVVIEEKLEGEEFSLMSFCDGHTLAHMPLVQDHKRVGEGDTGPNTGGMGSYSCSDHSLPFVRPEELRQAQEINEMVAASLLKETGEPYKGILYGGFMVTASGLKLLEYNARFGDPETMNVLSILESDLASIFRHIIAGSLSEADVQFSTMATVCKYKVPNKYPDDPVSQCDIDLSEMPAESNQLKIYPAGLDHRGGSIYRLTGSRALGVVGVAQTLEEAESIAESAAVKVKGPVFHRRDIGTAALVQLRVDHLASLRRNIPANR